MSRRVLFGCVAAASALLIFNSIGAAAARSLALAGPTLSEAPGRGSEVTLVSPGKVVRRLTTAVIVNLPSTVAAVEGRVFVNRTAAEIIGVAPLGGGVAMRPVAVGGGYSFGAYGLRAVNGQTTIRLVLFPTKTGKVQVRVIIDAAADKSGHRLALGRQDHVATLGVGHGQSRFLAPQATPGPLPSRPAGPARDLVGNGHINRQDLDTARGDWNMARDTGKICGSAIDGDANSDGCVDIVDLQAELAAQGQIVTGSAAAVTQALAGRTFTVNSVGDTPDAAPGDGICADSLGQCTLRAAMTEADWLAGDDRIEFALVGTAPVTIQVASRLPMITSTNGTVTIDGYTQPGSQVNTATTGSNAVTGVEVRGNGATAKEVGFYITSAGNTIRGLLIDNFYNGIFVDGTGAHDNRIVGNWIGFKKDGTSPGRENFGVVFNTGANHNFDGSPDLTDRNVIGNYVHAEENYGPGTDFNTTQGNAMCMTPNGMGTATCDTGIDHNFGPKSHLIGGSGPGERNVIGPSTLQGIEFSHGWDPSTGTSTLTWQINDNQAIGNWVGFRGDGSYNAAFRSALNFSNSDNGQAINVYDGSNNNLVQGNYIASVYDGVQVESPRAVNNIVRSNIIGVSPLGETAPLTRWGVVVRWATQFDVVDSNTIRNAAAGGVGLLNTDNSGSATAPAYNIRISRNIVTDTTGPAIALFGTANDSTPPPAFSSTSSTTITGTSAAGATVELYRASRAVGQNGLPTAYLGNAVAASDGTWTMPVSLQLGDIVTALQIRSDQNTSALAANVAVGGDVTPNPPAAPTGLTATVQAGPQVKLTWTDNANNETGFSIERAVGTGAFSSLASVGTDVTSYVDTTVTAGTTYSYRVFAQNAGGSSGYSNTATAVVDSIPAAPTGLTATVQAGPQVQLSWTDQANNETGFLIQRAVGTGAFSSLATVGANVVTFTDTTVVLGNTYSYRVAASNLGGSSAYSNIATTVLAPNAPTGLTATVQSGPQVRLSWTDHATNETSFSIERQTGADPFSVVGTVAANIVTFTDTTVTPGTTYVYRVRAQNSGGFSAYSNTASADVPAIPAAPSGLAATASTSNGNKDKVVLTWTDNATNETGFTIERATNSAFTAGLNTTTVGANVQTSTQTGLSKAVTYWYRVRATNLSGASAWSNVVSVLTP